MHPTDLEDPTLLTRLSDPTGIDGHAWLASPTVAIGELSADQARLLIEELYRRGAFRVVICDLALDGEREVAASVVVQRNTDPDAWQDVFGFCTAVCDRHGSWRNPDFGQTLLILRVNGDSASVQRPDRAAGPQLAVLIPC